ncbi:hypothetical protein E2K93_17175 [Thalassotalea sp. HSM 43]|uniref:hypothetical protein n=1 Tax=Thalassotalea sp. HSM 43 TaxID=2552945 RepID=UPI001080B298|nr:hypothetical protein [Thalassotalea sp. HSM 43]QBY05989.1 hypothetical protein E2K93_17175 [Thalassotalea sp. HSM 43]
MDDNEKLRRFLKTEEALKDILYMYYTCFDYSSLFTDMGTEDGNFDPYYFIDCGECETGYPIDYELLHHGSAIKISCRILQAWEQGGYKGYNSDGLTAEKELISNGRMDHIPELREYILASLNSHDEGLSQGAAIYKKYVLGFFQGLTK